MGMACLSSGLLTADKQITTVPARLMAVTILSDGSNNATLVVHDSLDNSGTALGKGILPAADLTGHIPLPVDGVQASTALYADMTVGAGAMAYIVYYREGTKG